MPLQEWVQSTSDLVFFGVPRKAFGFKKRGLCNLKNWIRFEREEYYYNYDYFYGREKVFLGHKIEEYKHTLVQYKAISYNIGNIADRATATVDFLLRNDQALYFDDYYGYFYFENDPFDKNSIKLDPRVSRNRIVREVSAIGLPQKPATTAAQKCCAIKQRQFIQNRILIGQTN